MPAKFFIELAGGKLTEWEHSSKVAKFEISGNKLEIDCKNGTYKINNAPKEDLMFEIIIEDGVLYLSQTDLFVKMFDTLWGNFMYNNTDKKLHRCNSQKIPQCWNTGGAITCSIR